VHLHGDGGAEDVHEERDDLFCEFSQRDTRVGLRVELRQRGDELRDGDAARAHGGAEERLLGVEVAEDGRRRDVQRFGDVGQRRGGEAAGLEGGACGVEDLFAGDSRWTAHR
jgi:hypothetical protein